MMHFVRVKGPRAPLTAALSLPWASVIFAGPGYDRLTEGQKSAVVLHEMYHCMSHHTEWRIVAFLFPFIIPWLCRRQEFAADRYAALCGHAQDLIEVLANPLRPGSVTHPSHAERIERLLVFASSTSRMAPA